MEKQITINGAEYVLKSSIQSSAADAAALHSNMLAADESVDALPYCVIRTQSSGVFAGYLESFKGDSVTLLCVRRIWYWSGAASLSQIAMQGVSKPGECKFPIEVDKIILTKVIEVLYTTQKAQDSIKNVPVWSE
jgi:hypothetical protein